jgi:DNA polymerase-3 subunit alpha
MRALLRSMKPDNFEDISAVLALYRPGPMGANAHNDYADRKNGRKPVVPIHPELAEPLAEILGDTYGLIVYQEQVMAIAQQLAGYSLGKADLLRRAMGKKKKEILDKEYIPFSDGMKANGYSDDAIKTLWDTLVPFADYAFNRATPPATGWSASGRPTSRRTTRPSTWPRC